MGKLIPAWLLDMLGLHFDRAIHATPGPVAPRRTAPVVKLLPDFLTTLGGQPFRQTVPDFNGDMQFEAAGKMPGRSPALTPADNAALCDLKGCDLAVAAIIKAEWAKGPKQTNAVISRTLTRRHGKGFSERTVWEYTSRFKRVEEGMLTPTPEA